VIIIVAYLDFDRSDRKVGSVHQKLDAACDGAGRRVRDSRRRRA